MNNVSELRKFWESVASINGQHPEQEHDGMDQNHPSQGSDMHASSGGMQISSPIHQQQPQQHQSQQSQSQQQPHHHHPHSHQQSQQHSPFSSPTELPHFSHQQNQPFHPFNNYPHTIQIPRRMFDEQRPSGHNRFPSAPIPQTSSPFFPLHEQQTHPQQQHQQQQPFQQQQPQQPQQQQQQPHRHSPHVQPMTGSSSGMQEETPDHMRHGQSDIPVDLESSLTNLLIDSSGDLKMGAENIMADLNNQFSQVSAQLREQQSPLNIRKDHKFAKALGGTDVRNTDTLPTYTIEIDVQRLLDIFKFFLQLLEGALNSGGGLKTQAHMTFEENLNLNIDLDAFYHKYSSGQTQLPSLDEVNVDYILNHSTMRALLRRQNRVVTKKRRKLSNNSSASIPQKNVKHEVLRDGVKNAQTRVTPCDDNSNLLIATFPNLVVTKSATAQKKVSLRFELCVDGWAFFYIDSANSFQTISVHGCKHQAPKKITRIHPNYSGVWGNRIAVIHGMNFKNVPAWKKGELEVKFGENTAEVLKIDGTMVEVLVPPNNAGAQPVTLIGVKKGANNEIRRDTADGPLTFEYLEEQDYIARLLRDVHQEKTAAEQDSSSPLPPPQHSGAMSKEALDHRRVKSEGQQVLPSQGFNF